MSLSNRPFGLLALVVCALLVAGCGFRPLYAPPAEGSGPETVYAFQAFRAMEIGPINDRDGQYLRSRLTRLFHPKGRDRVSRYELDISLVEGETSLAVKKSAVATRANLTVESRFSVVDLQAGDVVFSSTASVVSGFNIFESEFQTLSARDGARRRALDELSQEIRIRLATFFTRPSESPGGS